MTVATRRTTPAPTNGAMRKLPQLRRYSAGVKAARLVINGVEGWGKTSLSAHAPKPVILMARDETGFETLRQSNRVPDAPAAVLDDWQQTLDLIPTLAGEDIGTVVLDALGGFERLCHEHVCKRDFGGEWGEKGFASFQKGYDMSVSEWLKMLQALDALRDEIGCNVILLSHAKVVTHKNPMGPDFDRYTADCHHKTWSVTHKWADAVLFGTFLTVAVEDRKTRRTRGIGGTERVLYTERCDAYDAKNRYGLPSQIDMGGPETMWANLWSAMNGQATADAVADDVPAL